MKAIVHRQYGAADLLVFEDVPKPEHKDDEVLIKVQAASVNSLDWRIMTATPFLVRLMGGGIFKPKSQRLGADVAGVVEAVGKDVKDFKPKDKVFGDVGANSLGAFGEYVCAKESAIAHKPAKVTFEQAAATPVAGMTALLGLREGGLKAGQKVLVNGASSGVGSFAVQIAKAYGAEVSAVCRGEKADVARKAGADHIIDNTQEDFTKSKARYDLILDIAAYKPVKEIVRVLVPGGSYGVIGGSTSGLFKIILFGGILRLIYKRKFYSVIAQVNREIMDTLKELLETKKVVPYIEKSYPLAETAEAIRYVQERHSKGKVVIKI